MAVADQVIAVDPTHFALTETKLGLIPATIGPFVIAKIGGAKARSVFITGSMMTAEQACHLGLVSHVVSRDGLDDALAREVNTALKAAPGAMARAKAMLRQITSPNLDAEIALAIDHLADCWESEETQGGIAAFFDKTPPPWLKA